MSPVPNREGRVLAALGFVTVQGIHRLGREGERFRIDLFALLTNRCAPFKSVFAALMPKTRGLGDHGADDGARGDCLPNVQAIRDE